MSKPPSKIKTFNLRQLRKEIADDTAIMPPLNTSNPPPPEAYLVCICPSGPGLGRRYEVGAEPVTIGRDNTCTIAIPDGSVSRTHARIVRQIDGRYHIEDLGSTNGTFVNNSRVPSGIISDGDYLRVGQCIYRFLAGGNIEAGYHEELHRLAIMDALTGLHNRRYLNESLDREVERARRHGRPLSVLLLDIDHFKAVNDRFGHLAGDFALKNVAARLSELTRREELLARYGGEEFALVLPETELDGAISCGERLRRAIAERPFEFEGQPYPITVSVGIGTIPIGHWVTPADLLREADGRLYEAKRAGRNRVAPAAPVGLSSSVPTPVARAQPPEQPGEA